MTAPATIIGRVREVWDYLTQDEQGDVMAAAPFLANEVPADWRERVPRVFPHATKAPFAKRHAQLWDWANAIEADSAPRPFCAFWGRGGAKSSSAEMVVSDLGCRGKRFYALYIRMIQDKANESILSIGARLESEDVAKFYPAHARRSVTKYGSARGWSRQRLWTAGGFIVDAMGLDTAARGTKLLDQRPDIIVFDDIDALHDGPAATAKKIETITKSILPAGSNNCAVLFIQNIILRDGVAAQLADGRAGFLLDRIVSGPFPAVEGLRWTYVEDKESGIRQPVITAGRATWEGQPIEVCQRQMMEWGPAAFLKEAQHEVKGGGDGIALQLPADAYVDLTDDEVEAKAKRSRAFAGIDFGSWRFGFVLFFMDEFGKVTRVDEFFSQRESLDDRAAAIHDMVERAGIPDPSAKTCIIWGDAANPTDIREINSAFKRVGSRLRVAPVGHEGKMRKTAVERINNALATGALKFRRSAGHDQRWMLGANAGSEGTQMIGSRLMWEIDHWSFPVPVPGEPQDQNPDDSTADGADLIAAMRYALMSFWKRPDVPVLTGNPEEDDATLYDFKAKRQRKQDQKIEEFLYGTQNPDLDIGAPAELPLDW